MVDIKKAVITVIECEHNHYVFVKNGVLMNLL